MANPFLKRLWGAFGFPLGSTGIISLFFVGFVRALTSYAGTGMMMVGASAFVLRQGLYWAFIFFIIRSCANGVRRMGVFGFTDLHSDLIAPAIKGILSTAILWIPAAVYVYLAADSGLAGLVTYPVHRDPAVWLLVLLGAFYAPMALVAAATDLGLGHILNPIFIGQTIVRVGKDYFVAVVAVGMVLLIGGFVSALIGVALALVPVPFVGRWIAFTIDLYPPFVAAAILGILLYVHGEVLDWGRSEEYYELLLPGVEPRGQVRVKPEQTTEPQPARIAIPVPALGRGSTPIAEWPVMGMDKAPSPLSILNLSSGISAEMSAAGQATGPPSLLNLSVVLAPGTETPTSDQGQQSDPLSLLSLSAPSVAPAPPMLEAQAFIEHGNTGAIDLQPLDLPVSVATSLAKLQIQPPPPVASPPPVVTTVSPPKTSSAPTVLGFSPALPVAEAPPTVIGHTGLALEVSPTGPQDGGTGKGGR